MSLLLDALRRASAKRDDPLAERLDVGRHAPAADESAAAAPAAPDAETSAPKSVGGRSEDDLALVPEADEQPAPQPRSGETTQPGETTIGGSQAQSGQRERAAAAALLHAGTGPRRGRGSQLLGLTLVVLIVAAGLTGGGWLWYMQSQDEVAGALGGYRPEPAQAELDVESIDESVADPASRMPDSEAENSPAESGNSKQVASVDESSAGSPSAAPESEGAGPADSDEAQGTDASSEGDGAATVESTDPGVSAEPEDQLAQAAAQLAGESSGTNGAAQAGPAPQQSSTSDGGDAAAASDTGANDDSASAAANSAGRAPSADLVESSNEDSRTRQSTTTPSAATQPPRPMIKPADDAPLVEALNTGYRALGAGDLVAAERSYARARRLAPDNRDALLGMAAVRLRQGNVDAARRLYLRVLDSYPRDVHAQAALAAIDAGATRRNETTLKTLLRENPNAPALHFALGNVYAAEARWSEARLAYARAAEAAPDDPDYAYNLAVALDHLGRRDAARLAYAQALARAAGGTAEFDPAAVRRRLQQLR